MSVKKYGTYGESFIGLKRVTLEKPRKGANLQCSLPQVNQV